MRLANMLIYSAVGMANFELGTWGFRFIIGDSQLPNEN
jgi:hypothetical protein